MRAGARPHAWLAAAGLLWACDCLVFWPGYALYDSAAQYAQALSGVYDDWHAPLMAALWHATTRTIGGGAGPMLVLQLAGWWLGLGLLAGALGRQGRGPAAAAVLAIGAMPPWLGWQVVVLKDAQMAGALLAATGLIGWWRLQGRSVPWAGRLIVALLIGYAALVRVNAVFAIAPLVAMLGARRAVRRIGLGVGSMALILLATGPIDHRVLGADRSGVERTEALFDLAGMAVRVRRAHDVVLTPAMRAAIVAKRCATPYFWDPLGDDRRCGRDLAALRTAPVGELYRALAAAVAAHPVAYARARLSHLNSTERWLVPRGWPGVEPPTRNEANTLGLAEPGRTASMHQRLVGRLAETPLAWPIMWVVLAGAVVASALRRPRAPARDLALALAASALGQEASFALLSIASDWRYHLWSTVATAVALVLTAERPPPRRFAAIVGALLAVVVGAGVIARLVLPAPPDTYAGMVTAGAGPAF